MANVEISAGIKLAKQEKMIQLVNGGLIPDPGGGFRQRAQDRLEEFAAQVATESSKETKVDSGSQT